MPFYLLRIIVFGILKMLSRSARDMDASLNPVLKDMTERPLSYFSSEQLKELVKKGRNRIRKVGLFMLLAGLGFAFIFNLFFYVWRQKPSFDVFNDWFSMPVFSISAIALVLAVILLFASLAYEINTKTKIIGFSISLFAGTILCSYITSNYSVSAYGYLGSYYLTPLFYISIAIMFFSFILILVLLGLQNKARRKRVGWTSLIVGAVYLFALKIFPCEKLPEFFCKYVLFNGPPILLVSLTTMIGIMLIIFSYLKKIGDLPILDLELSKEKNTSHLPAYFSDLVTFRVIGPKDWKRNVKAEYNPYSLPNRPIKDIPDDEIYLL